MHNIIASKFTNDTEESSSEITSSLKNLSKCISKRCTWEAKFNGLQINEIVDARLSESETCKSNSFYEEHSKAAADLEKTLSGLLLPNELPRSRRCG